MSTTFLTGAAIYLALTGIVFSFLLAAKRGNGDDFDE